MINEKIQLLHDNNEVLSKSGKLIPLILKVCSAFSLTIKNQRADLDRIKEAINVVKDNTSVMSNFRGNNLLTIATTISLEPNMEEALKELIDIYNKLKKKFLKNEYLVLTSIVIFNTKNIVNIDDAIENTRVVYDNMKKNHRFLTGSEDISAAAMIATTSSNYEKTFAKIEEYYNKLKDNGFSSGNNLQSLSHMLALFPGTVDENVAKVVNMNELLKENGVPLKRQSMQLLSMATIISDNPKSFAEEAKNVSDALKKEKGFGILGVGDVIKNMIAVGIVTCSYVENLNEADKDKLVNAANNVSLTVQIAMQVTAIAASSAAASAAAASSSGN